MNNPEAAITALAETAAEKFLARYLEETGTPGNLHDCCVFKVGYTDGLTEATTELEAAIRTLTAQLAAQRAIVAADDACFAEWKYPTGDLAAWDEKMRGLRDACREARKDAKTIDEGGE